MTTDIHAATQAIREALAAGPTPGPWLLATSNSWRRFVAQDMTPVCEPVTQNDGHPDLYFRNGGADGPDARFIAAANPKAITTILAALEARDAEIAALTNERDDARRAKTGHFSPAYLLANARRLAAPEYAMMPNWVLATQIFAVGSTTAHAICRENGIDPDSKTAHPGAAIDAARSGREGA